MPRTLTSAPGTLSSQELALDGASTLEETSMTSTDIAKQAPVTPSM
jgi:hypothetical protein